MNSDIICYLTCALEWISTPYVCLANESYC